MRPMARVFMRVLLVYPIAAAWKCDYRIVIWESSLARTGLRYDQADLEVLECFVATFSEEAACSPRLRLWAAVCVRHPQPQRLQPASSSSVRTSTSLSACAR